MSIQSQSTTSNDSCDRLNSNQPSQFFTCPPVFHGDTTQRRAYVGAGEEMMCVWLLHRGHSGDGCDLASILCKYDLRKGDLFVLS